MLQLAGHLRGHTFQEWSLLCSSEKASYAVTVKALKLPLDPGSRTLEAHKFRHTLQSDTEKVADFIRRLEHTFNGREGMSNETQDTLLHEQLQDALKHELMQAPAVSVAQTYQELCLAARNKEKQLADLKKRQQYLRLSTSQQQQFRQTAEARSGNKPTGSNPTNGSNTSKPSDAVCFFCHKPGHIACHSNRGRGGFRLARSKS